MQWTLLTVKPRWITSAAALIDQVVRRMITDMAKVETPDRLATSATATQRFLNRPIAIHPRIMLTALGRLPPLDASAETFVFIDVRAIHSSILL
jgi:hypothetical protein